VIGSDNGTKMLAKDKFWKQQQQHFPRKANSVAWFEIRRDVENYGP